MTDILILIISISVLAWSSLVIINAAVKLSKINQLSDLFIGMVILAIGSDLTEK